MGHDPRGHHAEGAPVGRVGTSPPGPNLVDRTNGANVQAPMRADVVATCALGPAHANSIWDKR